MYVVPLATHNGHLGGKTKVAVVERFKQESMYRLSAKKVAVVEVVVSLTVFQIPNRNNVFLFCFLRSQDCFPAKQYTGITRPCQGGPMSPVWILKRLLSVFINACRLLSALPSLSQFGWGRLSLVATSFYALSLLFGPCCLSEFTLAGTVYYGCINKKGFILYCINTSQLGVSEITTYFCVEWFTHFC